MMNEPCTFFSNSHLANGENPFKLLPLNQGHFIQRAEKNRII